MPDGRLNRTRLAYAGWNVIEGDPDAHLGAVEDDVFTVAGVMLCPDCNQPVNLMTGRLTPVTDPIIGYTVMHRESVRYCPSAFHLVLPDHCGE